MSERSTVIAFGSHLPYSFLLGLVQLSATTSSQCYGQWRGEIHDEQNAMGSSAGFAFGKDRPLAFFGKIWVPQWTSVRKIKEGGGLRLQSVRL